MILPYLVVAGTFFFFDLVALIDVLPFPGLGLVIVG